MARHRARTDRRRSETKLRRLVRDRERLTHLEPGGAPERPLQVSSPAVIELRAASTPCVQCGGELAVEEHAAVSHEDQLLRRVHARCRRCGTSRTLWFALASSLPS